MATEQINEIVGREAFDQVTRLQNELKDTVKVFTDLAANAKAFDTVLRGAKGLQQLQQAIKEGANAQELLVAAGKEVIETTTKIKEAQKVAGDSLVAYKGWIKQLTNEYEALGKSETADIERKEQIRKRILALNAAYTGEKKALADAKKGIDAADKSYYALQETTNNLQRQLKNMPDAWNKETGAINKNNKQALTMAAQIRTNNDLLKKYDATLGQHFRNVGNYQGAAKSLKSYFTYLTGFAGAAFVAASATRTLIDNNIKISDSLTEVQRVGGLTDDQINSLYDSLKKINTRESLSGLLDLARIGAQMGVSAHDLGSFTGALNELTVTLGNELQGGAEGIATSLGKINNLLDITNKYGEAGGLKKTGSAILAVGQATIATGGYLADFAERVGGVAKIAHITLPTILAYGATLEANGVTAELAGTNFQRLITQLGRVPEKFYAIAKAADPKLTLEQFTNYINTDADKALQLFFKGLGQSTDKFTDFAKLTKSIGLPGQRVAQILAAIATSADDVARNAEIANKAFVDATLIDQQYALKNDNLAGSVEQLKNEMIKLTTDPKSDLGKFFKGIVQDITFFIRGLNNAGTIIKKLGEPFVYLYALTTTGSTKFAAQAVKNYEDSYKAQKDYEGKSLNSAKDYADAIVAQQKKVAEAENNYNASASLDRGVFGQGAGTSPSKLIVSNATLARYHALLQQQKVLADLQAKAAQLQKPIVKGGVSTTPPDDPAAIEKATKATAKHNAELRSEASKQIALDKAARDAAVKNAQDEAKAEAAINAEKLSNDIATQQFIMNDSNKSLDERLAAFKKYVEDEKKLIETEKENQIKAIEDKALAQALKQKQNQALLNAQKKKGGQLTDSEASGVISLVTLTPSEKDATISTLSSQIEEITLTANDRLGQFIKKLPNQTLALFGQGIDSDTGRANAAISAQADKQLMLLNDQYASRLLTERQFNKQKEQINFDSQSRILQNQIDGQKKFLDEVEKDGGDVATAKEKLANLEMSLSDLATEHIIGNEEKQRQAIINTLQAVQEYGGQLMSIIGSSIDNSITAQKNELQDQIDAINNNKQAEIDAIQASQGAAEDKANRIAVLNARAQAQTESLARRQQQLDEKKAKFDKAKTIFDIILGTASAVVEALPNIPLSIIIGALGVAELAVAAAAPIPTYFKGRDGGPAEWALVSEQGPEMMTMPSGEKMLTPEKPAVMFIPEGASIKPHNETILELARQRAMSAAANMPYINEREFNRQYIQELTSEVKNLKGAFADAVSKMPQTKFAWTERGVQKYIERGAAYQKWVNKNIS